MKKFLTCLCLVLILATSLSACDQKEIVDAKDIVTAEISNDTTEVDENTVETTNVDSTLKLYTEGDYTWQGKIDTEGYQTFITYKIENGLMKDLDWYIYDTRLKRKFDETYKEVFEQSGQPEFVEQSINDWAGAITYAPALIDNQGESFDAQDIEDLDAISGATWTYRKFKTALMYSISGIQE